MKTHILLVEDEVKLARFVELELSSEGYHVSVAHDGMSGLTLARDAARVNWGGTLSPSAGNG